MTRLISDAYQKLNYELHKREPGYGAFSHRHAVSVAQSIRNIGARSILDYGCGKGALKPALHLLCPDIDFREYDPCIAGKSAKPRPADMVLCLDVMEHIEPELLDNNLAHIKSLTKMVATMTIATVQAQKTLSDGRNAHLIVKPKDWWIEQLRRHFSVVTCQDVEDDFCIHLRPLKT